MAYQRALELLSLKAMGPTEMKLKNQYSAGLITSREKQSSKDLPSLVYAMSRLKSANGGQMPWDCAKRLTSSSSVGPHSSVRSIPTLLITSLNVILLLRPG